MRSIAKAVEEIVLRQPFLADALQRGIVNYGAVADELLPVLSQELDEEPKHAAVMMALRRLAERLEEQEVRAPRFGEEGELAIRSNLFELTVVNSKSAFKAVNNFREQIAYENGELLTVTHGIHELTIISNRKHLAALRKALRSEDVRNVTEELSLLTVRIPLSAQKTPGYFYTLTKALAWEGINIVEIVSTLTEMTFALSEKDVPRAYQILKDVMDQQNGKKHS
jgi:aspartokinase